MRRRTRQLLKSTAATRRAISPRDPGVVDDQGGVRAHGRAVGQGGDAGQQPGRERRSADALGVRFVDGLVDDGSHLLLRERDVRWHRDADQDAAAEPHGEDMADLVRGHGDVRDALERLDPRRAGVEARHVFLADGDDRHAAGLEVFERRRDVQDGLRSGADDRDGRAAELLEVRRDVERRGDRRTRDAERPAVDAADAAGRMDRDAGGMRGDHRRGDRGGGEPGPGEGLGEGRPRRLLDRPRGGRRECLQLRGRQPDEHPAVHDGDRRRDGARLADRGLGGEGDLEVRRVREAMADQRRLEGDDPLAVGKGLGDLGLHEQAVLEHRGQA